MYLSRLEILGFKSFAQKVDLSFDGGITAIVGPNGCGKTNIVDAIRWVLGEQRTTTLRSSKMEDVIFNGTKNRKALGFAETSLTIENTKGILPSEYTEVTITRRMFRSGESEYLLNKTQCRLKDILNLFMDTGMGANAYSVIELKMVEQILSDRTDERRRLFEEAAGVTKYKRNRKIAFNKLDDVQKDLLRVNDIIKEVQTTVNSLHRQAKKAERYNEFHILLKQLEQELLEREYSTAIDELRPLEMQLNSQRSEKQVIDTSLHTEEQSLELLRNNARDVEESVNSALNSFQILKDEIHSLEERNVVLVERSSALNNMTNRFEGEKDTLILQRIQLDQKNVTIGEQKKSLEVKIQQVKIDHQHCIEELQAVEQEEVKAKAVTQVSSDEMIDALRSTSSKQGEVQKMSVTIKSLQANIERIEQEIETYSQKKSELENQLQELTLNDREVRKRFAEAELSFFEKENLRTSSQKELEQLQRSLLEFDSIISQKHNRIDFLKGLVERNEGLSEGAKFLLSHQTWKTKLVPIADVIRVHEDYRIAIETALGETREYLIAKSGEEAEEAISLLKQEDKGKVTFVCLDRISLSTITSTLSNSAVNFIDCADEFRPIVSLLLSDVVLVNEINDARAILEQHQNIRCIAKDGQLATHNGLRRGGSIRKNEGISIGRQSQIEELLVEVSEFQKQKESVRQSMRLLEEQLKSVDIKALQNFVKDIEREMAQVETRIAQIAYERKHAEDSLHRLYKDKESVFTELQNIEQTIFSLTAELSLLEKNKLDKEDSLFNARAALSAVEQMRQEKAENAKSSNIKLISLEGEQRNLLLEQKHNEQLLDENGIAYQRSDQGIVEAKHELELLVSEQQHNTIRLNDVRGKIFEAEQKKKNIEAEYQTLRRQIEEREKQIKDQRRLHELSTTTVHELEIHIAELKSNIAHLRERAATELKIELGVRTFTDEVPFNIGELRIKISELKEKIESLGGINFEAFEQLFF